MPLTLCIAGYYGVRNTGDDLLLHEIWNLWDPGSVEVNVLCKDSTALQQELPMAKQAKNFAQVSGWQDAGSLNMPCSEGAKRLIAESDILIIGGGGLLGNGRVFASPEVLFAQSAGKPVMLMGVGVDPFTSKEVPALRAYFKAVDAVTTRDHWSWHNLEPFFQDLNDGLYEDRVVCLSCPVNGTQVTHTARSSASIVLSHSLRWARGDTARTQRLVKQVNAITASLSERGTPYEFLAFSPRQKGLNDVELYNEFKPYLRDSSPLITLNNVPEVVDYLMGSSYVIGDRFHALVLSCRFGIPFVGVVMGSKQREICMDAGQPWFYPHKDNEKHAAASVKKMIDTGTRPREFVSPEAHRHVAERLL